MQTKLNIKTLYVIDSSFYKYIYLFINIQKNGSEMAFGGRKGRSVKETLTTYFKDKTGSC